MIVGVALILAYLFGLRSHSVLYRYYETGNPVHEPAVAIFNPFGDRQPERTAEEFITRLGTGNCTSLMRKLSNSPEFQQQTCEHETTNPVISMKLRNRTDEPEKTQLYYMVTREKFPTFEGPAWLTLENSSGTWRVTRYDRYY